MWGFFLSKGDKFRTLKLDNLSSLSTRVGHKVSDSGYVSHATEETLPLDPAFSEQPVHAFLKPSEFKGENFILSILLDLKKSNKQLYLNKTCDLSYFSCFV